MAPDFALGHAVHGLCRLLLARRELVAVAEVDWRTADAARRAVPITARENAVVDALRDWLDGFPARAAHRLDTALRAHPSDAVLMKLVHSIRFLLGDAPGMRCSIEAVLGAFDDTHPAFGYLQGCYAFALEETGDYAAAERTGRRALEITPDDVWGLHAVAHVLDMTGRSDEGRAWLEERTEAWSHCNNFRYHVWWHLALMYLDRGDIGKVLALYDQEIRADHSDDFRDVANGASLLMRLELEGVNVGGRWEELARIAETRIDDACNVFADLHYLLSLNGGERRRAAETLVAPRAAQRRMRLRMTWLLSPRSSAPRPLPGSRPITRAISTPPFINSNGLGRASTKSAAAMPSAMCSSGSRSMPPCVPVLPMRPNGC